MQCFPDSRAASVLDTPLVLPKRLVRNLESELKTVEKGKTCKGDSGGGGEGGSLFSAATITMAQLWTVVWEMSGCSIYSKS